MTEVIILPDFADFLRMMGILFTFHWLTDLCTAYTTSIRVEDKYALFKYRGQHNFQGIGNRCVWCSLLIYQSHIASRYFYPFKPNVLVHTQEQQESWWLYGSGIQPVTVLKFYKSIFRCINISRSYKELLIPAMQTIKIQESSQFVVHGKHEEDIENADSSLAAALPL